MLEWWQAALGGLGSLLMGWGIGHRRKRRSEEDQDTLDARTAARFIDLARQEHLSTRVEVRQVLDAIRLEFEELLEKVQSEHEKQMALQRDEGQKMRQSVFATSTEIAKLINELHRDLIRAKAGDRP